MKATPYGLLFALLGTLCFGQQGSEGMRAIDPTIKITKASQTGSIFLEIGNPSKQPLKLWEAGNSWGAARWRVLRMKGNQVQVFFKSPYQIFTGNIATVAEIAPGTHLERALDINRGNWCGLGHCSRYNERGLGGTEIRFDVGDTIVVIYDVPPTKESEDRGVWHGVAAAFVTVK